MSLYGIFKPVYQPTIATSHIGIALDNNGRIISRFDFPSKDDYEEIDTNYSYCELIAKAREVQRNIDSVKEIKLEFNPKTKALYWVITQALVNGKEGINYFNQVYIYAADLSKTETTKESVNIIY